MQSNRPRDTALETAVRSALHRRGLRFRKHVRPIRGLACTVDVAFPRERLAVFIDGCYWHLCPEHASYPKANAAWWRTKLEGNRDRDRRNEAALAEGGWTVLRVWEHEELATVVMRVTRALEALRPS